jgi:hypothetical protein
MRGTAAEITPILRPAAVPLSILESVKTEMSVAVCIILSRTGPAWAGIANHQNLKLRPTPSLLAFDLRTTRRFFCRRRDAAIYSPKRSNIAIPTMLFYAGFGI